MLGAPGGQGKRNPARRRASRRHTQLSLGQLMQTKSAYPCWRDTCSSRSTILPSSSRHLHFARKMVPVPNVRAACNSTRLPLLRI